MHTVRAARLRQFRVPADQQNQAARAAQRGQPPGCVRGAGCTKMPVNHSASTRQAARDGDWIGGPFGVGEEKKRWNSRAARVAVEPRRRRR